MILPFSEASCVLQNVHALRRKAARGRFFYFIISLISLFLHRSISFPMLCTQRLKNCILKFYGRSRPELWMVDGLTEAKQRYNNCSCTLSTLQTDQGCPVYYYHY